MPFSVRRIPIVAAALLALTVPVVARAQQPSAPAGPIKIAVIDTEKILLSSQTGKKALADLKKLQEAKEGEIRAKAQELKELQTKISEGRLSLAQDKLADLGKQYEEKEINLRRFQDDATRELNKKRDEILGQIDQRVMPVINQAGKEMGYTLIFRKFESGLIYADEAIDITNAIIQRLDGAAPAAAGKQGK
ncbi:MAG TPA: OmpH family outer membrane protein [Thermoanaerobaculia bacterium]|nr:OmpH family outer membrane protein [Thermoanaerobaculia bacterium]